MRRARAILVIAAGATALSAGTAAGADPVLPLGEVPPGAVGEARTVVQGTEITTFPVRILDIQWNSDSPGGALIIARAEGPLMEQTGGVAQGMSGSPVYITGADGVPRVIGAIAYGAGDQAGVIVGITPIEQMLRSNAGNRQFAVRRAPAPRRALVRARDRHRARAIERAHPDRIALYPLTRWMLSGVSRPAAVPLAASLEARGVQVSALGPRTLRPAQALVPGATMSVLLAGGDVALGGLGTVTYVDGERVIGFGHPFLGGGRSAFLLGDGYIYQTIAAPIGGSSYKLGEPGMIRGTVVADRTDGLTARLGPAAGVRAVARARDTTRGTRSTVRAVLASDERLLPLTAGLLQTEPALRVRDGIAGGTLRLTLRIDSPALRRPIVYRNTFAASGDVITLSSGDLPTLLAMLTQNGIRSLPVRSVTVDQRLETRVRQARMLSARVRPGVVRPGQRAVLVLRLDPWRAGPRTVRVPFTVPSGLRPGVRTLRVRPNTDQGFDPTPAALEQALGSSAATPRPRAVARLEARAARTPGPRAARVAGAALAEMGGRNDAVRLLAPGQDAGDPSAGRVLVVDHVITGPAVGARVRVRR
jgi:hypothetical protein